MGWFGETAEVVGGLFLGGGRIVPFRALACSFSLGRLRDVHHRILAL